MWAGDFKVFAVVVDFADSGWICVDSTFAIEDYSVTAPGGFPEFVGYLDVFFRYSIAVVVLCLLASIFW